ncbi:MAG TPA: MFS transporter [Actinospica sp.]|jgi:EmrB/QacA subfamily drug resistance transporter|nr:MFS transporter [Actinospica sp.]
MSTLTSSRRPPSAVPDRGTRRGVVLAVLCVSLLLVTLDNTILNIALPAVVRALSASDAQLQWIVDAYAVVFGGLLLAAGALADRVGRRRVFLAGVLIFAAGSAASAFSTSVGALVGARAVMAVGGACIMPSTLSIISDVFREPRERTRAIGLWSATSGLGIALGPVVGGWLLQHYWWGSVFLVNVPIALLGAAAALWLVPESRDPERRPVDVLGAALATSGLTLLLWAVIETPTRGWHDSTVLGVGAGGLFVLTVFVVWERHAKHPLLLFDALRDRRFTVAMSGVAMAVFALMGTLFVLTQYLQFDLGYAPFAAGIRVLPVAGLLAVTAAASSLLDRLVGTKATVGAAMALIAGGLFWIAQTGAADRYQQLLPGMLLLGAGAGLAVAASTASVIGSLPVERAGVGSATNGTALQVGGATGVAVMGSVLAAHYQDRIGAAVAGHGVPASALHAITGSLGGALQVADRAGPLGPALAAAARSAFLDGMTVAMGIAAAVVAAGLLLVLLALPNRAPKGRGTDGSNGPTRPGGPAAR